MINSLLDSWFKMSISDGAFYAGFGFLFVFIGIVILILLIWAIGKVIDSINGTSKRNEKKREVEEARKARAEKRELIVGEEDGITPEIVAAITAALMAYYDAPEQKKCDFIVKRIKRI